MALVDWSETGTTTVPSSNRTNEREISKIRSLFDGKCRACTQIAQWFKNYDSKGSILFQDVNQNNFRMPSPELDFSQQRKRIHGVLPDATVLCGSPLFARLYEIIDLLWLISPSGLRVLQKLSPYAYSLFSQSPDRPPSPGSVLPVHGAEYTATVNNSGCDCLLFLRDFEESPH